MAYDLFASQKAIMSYLRTQFPNFEFFRNTLPEDEQIPRQGSEVNPFFIVQFGNMYARSRGKSIKGPRNDQYFSWVQIIGVGSVDEDISDALAPVVDRLIGRKFAGTTGLVPDGGTPDYGSRQYSVRPVLYYQTQKFEFDLTTSGLDGYLSS